MNNQIKNSFCKKTVYKIIVEALKIGGVAAGLFILSILADVDFGQYSMIAIPAIRWAIGILEQYKKGE